MPYDIRYDPRLMDLNTDAGFIYALTLVLSCKDFKIPKQGGGAMEYKFQAQTHTMTKACDFHSPTQDGSCGVAAPVCSSWVFINMGTSGRSTARPLGNVEVCSVRQANKMVARTVLLLAALRAVGAMFILEQPRGSLMERHPRVQWLFQKLAVFKESLRMSSYGASTEKGTWLYSNKVHISTVHKHARSFSTPRPTVEMVQIRIDKHGNKKINGGKDLKASQSYPPGFGKAIARTLREHAGQLKTEAEELHNRARQFIPLEPAHPRTAKQRWDDAELDGVFALLR